MENKNAKPIYVYSFRYNFEEKIKGRIDNLKQKTKLVLKAESLSGQPEKLQVAIVDDKGYS